MKFKHPFLSCTLAALSSMAASAAPKSAGFSVSNFDRNAVLALWHSTYMASEGYENRIGWTGNYTGNAGTVSAAFAGDVERRVNYFRAMCGVPPVVRVNTESKVVVGLLDLVKPAASTTKSAAAQEGALLMARNYDPKTGTNPAISHLPPQGLVGWTKAAWNGNANGNIAFGLFGPGAVTEYMVEEIPKGSVTSTWNSSVGHRRWILAPEATDFATGDQPGAGPERPPTNVLYISQRPTELNQSVDAGFVAYPAAGFFPAPVNSKFWSLSRSGADFSQASVIMRDAAGKAVAVRNVKTSPTYGDPAIVWEVTGAATSRSVVNDTRFTVRVSGIQGDGIPATHEYTVVLINPDRLTSYQALKGPASVSAKFSAVFACPQVPGAEARWVTTFVNRPATWTETAERKKTTEVIDRTGKAYPLIANMSSFSGFGGISGKKAFHLTFPTSYDLMARGVPEQIFELDRHLLPKGKARLEFFYRRGFMTTGSRLAVEISRDGGVTWKSIGKPIRGTTNTTINYSVDKASFPLPKSNTPVRVRFRYHVDGNAAIYVHKKGTPTGIFIDDIRTRNCNWLEVSRSRALPAAATSFTLNSTSGGPGFRKKNKLMLGMTSRLGGHWFPCGPLKKVSVK